MKKLLLAGAIALMGATTVNAQTAQKNEGLKGTWFATAQLGYTSNGASGTAKETTFTAIPVVGTFVAPTTAVGVGVGVISSKTGGKKAVNTVVVEPLARKYWPVAGRLYFFGQAAVPMLFKDGSTTFGATLTPGLDYVVNSWFTVEFSTTVASLHFTTVDGGDTSTSFQANPFAHSILGTNSQIGFKFLF